MIHARYDYNRIQDPALEDRNLLPDGSSTPIGADEPVMLFRAQDRFFVEMLDEYHKRLRGAGKDDMARAVELQIQRAKRWQEKNGCKTPDLPK